MKFLRWIWPKLSSCPECNSSGWTDAGRKVQFQYRRCSQCAHVYAVGPAAREFDNGGQVSVIEPV